MYNVRKIIKNYETAGSKYGLDREKYLLRALGNPDAKLKIIHVAGSNGKGSVCAYLTGILREAGRSVGTFTSPAVYQFNEMFALNGQAADDGTVDKYLRIAYEFALTMSDKPTAFEIETAAALKMFADEGCEYAVIECGLGGLNDSTNAVAGKELAVITSVSLEHTALLGGTIPEICRQKGGIVKNCPLICSARLPREAKEYFGARGAIFAGEGLKILFASPYGQTFAYGGNIYKIRMAGSAQAYNAAVAVGCASVLGLPGDAVVRGLAGAYIAGRVEVVRRKGKTFILDGSHNPESFGPLKEVLRTVGRPVSLVFGCLSDKDVETIAAGFAGMFDEIITVTPPSYRAMNGARIYQAFAPYCENVTAAFGLAAALGAAQSPTVVVCGSFTILKEAREWIERGQ